MPVLTKTLRDELQEAKAKATALFAQAEQENRELTEEERASIQAHLDEARDIKARIDRVENDAQMRAQLDALQAPARTPERPRQLQGRPLSLGEQFVRSEAGEWVRNGRNRAAKNWQSPVSELEMDWEPRAATLTSATTSGGDLIVPDYRPGIQPLLFQRLMVADLIAPGTTDSNAVTYMAETTFTNAAAAVAEGAAKPESTLVFDAVTDTVKKIAHWLPVTDEMLEDVAQLRAYIDARLRLGVQIAEEDQLVNGSGTGANITGILNRSGIATAVAQAGGENNADPVFRQMMAIQTGAFLVPDGIVMNPTNWQAIALMKNANGDYFAGGPFATPRVPTLWGLPVAVTSAITAGTALVGAFRSAAQIFRKGGIAVEASNSHSDYFVKNLTAIRAEERLALAVYRPAAFGTVTGLD